MGAGGRWFESSRPDQSNQILTAASWFRDNRTVVDFVDVLGRRVHWNVQRSASRFRSPRGTLLCAAGSVKAEGRVERAAETEADHEPLTTVRESDSTFRQPSRSQALTQGWAGRVAGWCSCGDPYPWRSRHGGTPFQSRRCRSMGRPEPSRRCRRYH